MPLNQIIYTLVSDNRVDIRRELVEKFLEEIAGTGKKDLCSKYDYIVESYKQYKIVVKRPGLLNKGFDFGVDIDGVKFKNAKNRGFHIPSHKDIISILNQIKKSYPKQYSKVKQALCALYNLQIVQAEPFRKFKFKDYLGNEHPFYIVLLAIKWLFIEQDITYWNWSGRDMLRKSLEDEGLM